LREHAFRLQIAPSNFGPLEEGNAMSLSMYQASVPLFVAMLTPIAETYSIGLMLLCRRRWGTAGRITGTPVRNEAKALADLHQVSFALPEPAAADMRKHLVTYLELVRDKEWQTMANGLSDRAVTSPSTTPSRIPSP
jgi:hypothetical protein